MILPGCTPGIPLLPPVLPPASSLLRFERLGCILTALLLLLYLLQRCYGLISRFLAEKTASINLAIARIATMLALLFQVRYSWIARMAALDHSMLVPFRIWGNLATRLPLKHHAVTTVYLLFIVAASCALIGLSTRTACAITGLCSLYLLAIPQLSGKVDHDYGHLVVFCFILALSPSADALSLHAFLRSRRSTDHLLWLRPRTARVYAAPLQAMMLYIAFAYFFPGLWKLVGYGSDWFRPAHMHFIIAEIADGFGLTSFQLWFLNHPFLLALGAVVTIAFELGFLFLILSPKTRWLVVPFGLAFHNLTFLLMGIQFASLQALYVIFLDWTPLSARLPSASPPTEPTTLTVASVRTRIPLNLVCTTALAGILFTGATRKMLTWPINCYPTFDWPQSNDLEIRSLQAIDIHGTTHLWALNFDPVMLQAFGNERWKTMVWYDFANPASPPAQTAAAIRLWRSYHHAPPLTQAVIVSSIYARTSDPIHPRLLSSCTLTTYNPNNK